MNNFRKLALKMDNLFETVALLALLGVVLIVSVQVITRKLFNFVFFWSEEVTLVLLVWFSFMGMAIGFREYLHIGVDALTERLPQWFNDKLDKVIQFVNFGVGLYLLYYGWDFTVLAHESTLAATKLPNSVVYAVMPITGFMISAYSLLQLFGIDTKRHQGNEVEMVDMEVGSETESEVKK